MENEQQQKEFSAEKKNMEIIVPEEVTVVKKADDAVVVNRDGLDVKKGGNIIIGTLNVFTDRLKARHEKHYRQNYGHLALDLAIVATVLVMLGVLGLVLWSEPWKKDIAFEIKSASQTITSGKLENFSVFYKNNSGRNLSNVKIALILPDNFETRKILPADIFDSKTNTLQFGELASGANGEIKISGIVLGEIDRHQTLAVSASYNKNGFSRYEAESFNFLVEKTALVLSQNFPETIYQGAEFKSNFVLENTGDVDFKNLIITSDSSNGWVIQILNQPSGLSFQNNQLLIDQIKAGSKLTIPFTVSSQASLGEQKVKFTLSALINNNQLKQIENSQMVVNRELKLKISLSGSQSSSQPGDSLSYKVNYVNNEAEDIKNLRLTLDSGNKNYNFKIISTKFDKNFSQADKVFLAKTLKPTEKGEIDITTVLERQKHASNQEFLPSLEVLCEIGGQEIKLIAKMAPIKILSDLRLKSSGYYYSLQGDQLGVGPMPPIVGIPTRYWVIWELSNQGNDLSNFQLQGRLPANATWTDNTSLLAGNLDYNRESRLVTWTIDKINSSSASAKVGFEVQVLPEKKDVGRFLNLLDNIHYSAEDLFCGQAIAENLKNITTNLEYDSLSRGKGRVLGD